MLDHGAGNAKPLLLTAAQIQPTLAQIRIVPLGLGQHKVMGLRRLTSRHNLLVRGVFLTPADILLNGATKKHVLLQHHANHLPQSGQVVLTHIHPVNEHLPLGGVIQPGDQVHQTALAAAGATHNTDDLAGLGGKADMLQNIVPVALRIILKAHIPELYAPLGVLRQIGVLRIGNVNFCIQHLHHTVAAGFTTSQLQ